MSSLKSAEKTKQRRTRVLIVEDENIVALDIQNRLQRLGYEVVGVASSGELAIRVALDTRPDLLLMDIRLKGKMDGIEAAKAIIKQLQIPVVYLTAYADSQTFESRQAHRALWLHSEAIR
ncbi:MAG: response regulator [candidate division KSB1 bacterium]|nr:response regulator [candidate division KSB1 bacterium]